MKAIIIHKTNEVATLSAQELGIAEDASATVWLEKLSHVTKGNAVWDKLGLRAVTAGDQVRFEDRGRTISTHRFDAGTWTIVTGG